MISNQRSPLHLVDQTVLIGASPARRIITRSGSRARGIYNSTRLHRSLPWESRVELHGIQRADFCLGVTDMVSQPVQLHLIDADLRYTPDLVVAFDKSVAVIEFKQRDELDDEAVAGRLRTVGVAFAKFGLHFEVICEDQVDRQPSLFNIQTLLPHRRGNAQHGVEAQFTRVLTKLPCSFAEAAASSSAAFVLHILANGRLAFDLDQPLGETTRLDLPLTGAKHATSFI